MAAHDGPVVLVSAVFTSLVRQSDDPPASILFGSLGSRMNGAMKFALVNVSVRQYGAALQVPTLFTP